MIMITIRGPRGPRGAARPRPAWGVMNTTSYSIIYYTTMLIHDMIYYDLVYYIITSDSIIDFII